MSVCRHCHHGRVTRPRGLCWTCYRTPGVRDLYPTACRTSITDPDVWYVVGVRGNGERVLLSSHITQEASERQRAAFAPYLEGYREIIVEGGRA